MKVNNGTIKVIEAGSAPVGDPAGAGYLKVGECTESAGAWSGKLMNVLGAVKTYTGLNVSGQTETPFSLGAGAPEPYAAICRQLNVPLYFSEMLFVGKPATADGQKEYDVFGKVSAIQMDCD